MSTRFIAILSQILISVLSLYSQEFTLQNQYNKMIGKYPFIAPYEVSDSGLMICRNVPYKIVAVDGATNKNHTLCFDAFIPLPDKMDERYPLVVFIHGGGWASGSKEMDHQMAIALAQSGLSCVCVDYRKSGEALYPAAINDVCKALEVIVGRYAEMLRFNGKICLVGSSAGGQMASLIGCNDLTINGKKTPHIDRVIDIDGVLAFIHKDSSEGQDKPGKISAATRWFGQPLSVDSTLWHEASAVNHVSKKSADFVFIVGTQKRFTAGIKEMSQKLKDKGHSAETIQIFRNDATRTASVSENETPHCFWLFSPWAEKVVEAMTVVLKDF